MKKLNVTVLSSSKCEQLQFPKWFYSTCTCILRCSLELTKIDFQET